MTQFDRLLIAFCCGAIATLFWPASPPPPAPKPVVFQRIVAPVPLCAPAAGGVTHRVAVY